MNKRIHGLPSHYEASISDELESLGFQITDARRLAEAVLKLSDYYTQNPLAPTPWGESWAKAASLVYYFPLNYARNRAVATEAARLGFLEGLNEAVDFGSGTGSATAAFTDTFTSQLTKIETVDVSRDALALGRKLISASGTAAQPKLLSDFDREKRLGKSVLFASYVLTELEDLPRWWLEFEALVMVEPSTQEDGRKLMAQRQKLIEAGYSLWAPCTHQGACPLLTQSEKDWCHDRIHWDAPSWFVEIEKYLPMKNRTLTFSYLLARRQISPRISPQISQQTSPQTSPLMAQANLGRLTGDMLIEKGKTRQSVCRGPEREFLAWFPQRLAKSEKIELQRGNLIVFNEELDKKSSEVRLKSASSITEIAPHQKL